MIQHHPLQRVEDRRVSLFSIGGGKGFVGVEYGGELQYQYSLCVNNEQGRPSKHTRRRYSVRGVKRRAIASYKNLLATISAGVFEFFSSL